MVEKSLFLDLFKFQVLFGKFYHGIQHYEANHHLGGRIFGSFFPGIGESQISGGK